MVWPAIAAGAAVVGVGASIFGQKKAAKDAEKALEKQAQFTFFTRMEEIRRAQLEQKQVLGENKARIYASNILFSGSAKESLMDVQQQFAQDISWRRKAANLEQEAIKSGAPSTSTGPLIAKGVADIASIVAAYNK